MTNLGSHDSVVYSWTRRGVRFLIIGAFLVFAAFPLYWIAVNAIQNQSARFDVPPRLYPVDPSFKYLYKVLVDTPVMHWLGNSMLVSTASALLAVLCGVGGAYVLARFTTWYSNGTGFILLASQMVPPVVLMIPLFKIFLGIGLTDNLLGVIVADTIFALPVTTWVMKSAIEAIPAELEEAARLDGCGQFKVLTYVVVPLAMPGLVAGGMFAFMMSWEEFLFTRTLVTSSPQNWVGTVGMASFFGPYDTPWPLVMMGALLLAAPPVIVFMFIQSKFVDGLAGGVKA